MTKTSCGNDLADFRARPGPDCAGINERGIPYWTQPRRRPTLARSTRKRRQQPS